MNQVDHLSDEYENSYEFTEAFDEITDLKSPFSEEEELEFAYELLNITNDEELDYFLGKLFKKSWRKLKRVGSRVGRVLKPLGRVLKGVAKRVLPFAARAAGSFFGGPAGGAIAGRIGSMISSALEMELEGLPEEDKELEIARRFVRIAGDAALKAAQASQTMNPADAVHQSIIDALQKHVPGIESFSGNSKPRHTGTAASEGRWIRRGGQIILLGL